MNKWTMKWFNFMHSLLWDLTFFMCSYDESKNTQNNVSDNANKTGKLEALPMDDGWASFQVLLPGDPRAHLLAFMRGIPYRLESGKWSKDGSSFPDRVLACWTDFDLRDWWGKRGDLALQAVGDPGIVDASRDDYVGVKVLPDISIALIDTVVDCLVDTGNVSLISD